MPLRPWPTWLVHLLLLALCAAQQSDRDRDRPRESHVRHPRRRADHEQYYGYYGDDTYGGGQEDTYGGAEDEDKNPTSCPYEADFENIANVQKAIKQTVVGGKRAKSVRGEGSARDSTGGETEQRGGLVQRSSTRGGLGQRARVHAEHAWRKAPSMRFSRKLNVGTAQVGPCEPATGNVTSATAPSAAEPPVYTTPPLLGAENSDPTK